MTQRVCQVMSRDKLKETHSVGSAEVKGLEDSVDSKDSMINLDKVINRVLHSGIFSRNSKNSLEEIKVKEVQEAVVKHSKGAKIS